MNKEQIKFKKSVNSKKRQLRKKRVIAQERMIKRAVMNKTKHSWIIENKKISENNITYRSTQFSNLRQILEVPDNVIYTLEQLIKMSQNKKIKHSA